MTAKTKAKRKQAEQQIVNRYSDLTDDQLKTAINDDDKEISVLEAKQDQRMIAAGEQLIALKARAGHGQWLPTLKTLRDGKGLPQQRANQWMRYAKDPSLIQKERDRVLEAKRHNYGDLNDKDTFDDDWEAFKRKAKEQQRNGTYDWKCDDPNAPNYGGKPAEELVQQEVRKLKNAVKRLQEMAEFAEHIPLDDQTLDLMHELDDRVAQVTSAFTYQRLPKSITPDNPQLEVLHYRGTTQ